MATLSALQISVQVSKDYQAGLNKVKSDVDAVAKSVSSSISRSQASIASMTKGVTKSADSMKKSVSGVGTSFEELGKKTTGLGDPLEKTRKQTEKSSKTIIGSVRNAGLELAGVGTAGTLGLKSLIAAHEKQQSAFTGVRKTVNASEEELAKLSARFKQISEISPISYETLSRIGELGGQLGVGIGQLDSFADTVAKIAIATNLSEEEAATSFAQIGNVLGVAKNDMADFTLNLANSIVDLGNNFATTEADITNFVSRIAGAGKIAGLQAGQINGIAAAMSSVGIEAESGGTAVQKVLIDMTKSAKVGDENTKIFAKTLGLTTKQFQTMFDKDPSAVFARFVNNLGTEGDKAFGTLEDLGMTDQRLTRAFLSLAGAGDLVNRAIDKGQGSFENSNALQTEASRRFEDTAQKMQMYTNRADNMKAKLGEQLAPALMSVLDALAPVAAAIGKFAEEHPKVAAAILITVSALVALISTLALVSLALPAMTAIGDVFMLVGKNIGKSGLMASLGWLPFIIAIGLVVAAGYLIYKNWDLIKAKAIEVWGMIKTFVSGMWESFKGLAKSLWNFYKSLPDMVLGVFKSMWEGIKTFGSNIVEGFSAIWSDIKTGASDIWNNLKTGFSNLWNGIKTGVSDFITAFLGFFSMDNLTSIVATLIYTIGKFFLVTMPNFFKAIPGQLALAWNAMVAYAGTIWTAIKTAIATTWSAILLSAQTTLANIGLALLTFFTVTLPGYLLMAWNAFVAFGVMLWDFWKSIPVYAQAAFDAVIAGIVIFGTWVWTFFTVTLPGYAKTAWEAIKTGAATMIESVKNFFISLPETVSTTFNSIVDAGIQFGKDFVNSIIDGIKSIGGAIMDTVKSFISGVSVKVDAKVAEGQSQGNAYASGGHIRGKGTGTSDSIPAWLSNGEYVVRASAVKSLGVGLLNYINANGSMPAFAGGGLAGGVNVNVQNLNANTAERGVSSANTLGYNLQANLRARGIL